MAQKTLPGQVSTPEEIKKFGIHGGYPQRILKNRLPG